MATWTSSLDPCITKVCPSYYCSFSVLNRQVQYKGARCYLVKPRLSASSQGWQLFIFQTSDMRPVAHACESHISLETKGVTRLTKIKVDAGNYQIKFGRQSPIWEWHIQYIVGEAFAHFTPYSGNVELLFQRLDKKYSPYCEYKYPLQSCPNCIDVLTWIAGTKHCSAISALTTRN